VFMGSYKSTLKYFFNLLNIEQYTINIIYLFSFFLKKKIIKNRKIIIIIIFSGVLIYQN